MKTIQTDELKRRLDRGDHFRLVDARDAEAYRDGHLPGAVRLSPADVGEDPDGVLPDVSNAIVVYGADDACPECAALVDALEATGYEDVTWYRDGTRGWAALAFPLEAGGD